jgi:hypothetical protein
MCDLGSYEDSSGSPLIQPKACTFTAVVNLFCRLGPGADIYPEVDSFTPGQSAPVIGQSADGFYVYVEGPNNSRMCVVPVAEQFGELEGDCSELRVMIPPPVPEPTETPTAEPPGCTVKTPNGLVCQVPCPEDAKPGEPCTPEE